ncbi:hypothetical protein BGX29_005882 [Mortierella sp. GBA35]|nr:hypothetical protein BGX29_005882 [Mortierella sp. GBA35]
MTVAQTSSPRSSTWSRPGRPALTAVLLPSVALILAFCLLGPVPAQATMAVSGATVSLNAGGTSSSSLGGFPLDLTSEIFPREDNSRILASSRWESTVTTFDQEVEVDSAESAASMFSEDRNVTDAVDDTPGEVVVTASDRSARASIGTAATDATDGSVNENSNREAMAQAEDLIGGRGERLPFSLPPLGWIRTHLGTKSPYPHESRPVGRLDDVPEGYELVQLHLINRHGTRYPSASKSVGFKALTNRLKGVKLPGFKWIQNWPIDTLYPATKGNLLSVQGDSDLYQIGRRFAIRYKTLLNRYPYDANTYEFKSSAKSRCLQSAYGFSVGFFEGRLAVEPGFPKDQGDDDDDEDRPPIQPVDISMLPIGLDKELAVKYACPRWLENVDGQDAVGRQKELFEDKFLPQVASRITAALSSSQSGTKVNITVKDVGVIQNLCDFEISMRNNDQTWCRFLGLGLEGTDAAMALFQNFEIADDLDDFYTHGPGVPFNKHLGCRLGTSLLESIEEALTEGDVGNGGMKKRGDDDEDEPTLRRASFKFGHSETILFFSSFLGLYHQKGVPLTGNMTAEQYAKREFRTSTFSQFSANMAFEVYRPKESSSRPHKKRRLVYDDAATAAAAPNGESTAAAPRGLIRLLVNEVPMVLPGCGSDYFCEFSIFKQVLQRAGTGCDFDGCCSALKPASAVAATAPVAIRAANPAVVVAVVHPHLALQQEPSPPVCLPVTPIVN